MMTIKNYITTKKRKTTIKNNNYEKANYTQKGN